MTDFEPAEGARLVTVDAGRVTFVDPLIRTAVLANAAPADRRAVHRALAGFEQISLEARAWHLAFATQGVDAEAADLLVTAAESATNRGDHDAAAKLLDRASDLTPDRDQRLATLVRAIEASWRAGQRDRVRMLVDKGLHERLDPVTHARLLAYKGGTEPDLTAQHRMGLEAAALLAPYDASAAVFALNVAAVAGLAARSTELVRAAAQRALALDITADARVAYQRDSLVGLAVAISGDLPGALPALANRSSMTQQRRPHTARIGNVPPRCSRKRPTFSKPWAARTGVPRHSPTLVSSWSIKVTTRRRQRRE